MDFTSLKNRKKSSKKNIRRNVESQFVELPSIFEENYGTSDCENQSDDGSESESDSDIGDIEHDKPSTSSAKIKDKKESESDSDTESIKYDRPPKLSSEIKGNKLFIII